jgi:predicted transcriptional regulator
MRPRLGTDLAVIQNFKASPELAAAMKRTAAARKLTLSALIREAIQHHLATLLSDEKARA